MEVRQRGTSGDAPAGPERGYPLLAPLPRLHRIIVVASVIIVGVVAGIWVAQSFTLPAGGLLVGTGAGLVVAFLLTHDFHHQPRPVRIQRRH